MNPNHEKEIRQRVADRHGQQHGNCYRRDVGALLDELDRLRSEVNLLRPVQVKAVEAELAQLAQDKDDLVNVEPIGVAVSSFVKDVADDMVKKDPTIMKNVRQPKPKG